MKVAFRIGPIAVNTNKPFASTGIGHIDPFVISQDQGPIIPAVKAGQRVFPEVEVHVAPVPKDTYIEQILPGWDDHAVEFPVILAGLEIGNQLIIADGAGGIKADMLKIILAGKTVSGLGIGVWLADAHDFGFIEEVAVTTDLHGEI